MDFFREEHELFRQNIRRFVQKEIVPNVDEWETNGEIPRNLFKQMGELGFLGIEFDPEYGGSGADLWMSIVLDEEMAMCRAGGVAFSVVVHTDMSSPWLSNLGTTQQKKRFIPDIVQGTKVCALAITEPNVGSDMAAYQTTAQKDDSGWLINGTKTFITNGVYGDLYFVSARTNDTGPIHKQLSQFIVEKGTPGLTVSRKLDKTGMWSSDTAELVFQDVRVTSDNLIGEENKGFYQLAAGLQRERLLSAILSVSAASQALNDSVRYLNQRETFGDVLSKRQSLRHRVANLATELEAARQLNYSAASKLSLGKDCIKEVSMAKLFSTEAANRVAYEAVQFHGGYGYMRETPVERFSRDYRLWTIAAGTSEMMREIISKKILDEN